jgi:hypothetical protein
MLDLGPYLRRPASTIASIASDPLEAWIRFSEQFAASREAPTPPNLYTPNPEWESQLLRGLDGSVADRLNAEFWALWSKVVEELAAKGNRAGPASFKGWNDGDASFVRAVWILARRLKPRIVVETGVDHGVTSRFILEALEQTGIGELFSIDRAPIERKWQNEIGVAVDRGLRARWTYVRGSSRRRLPGLISRLGTIDLFVHDSLHSTSARPNRCGLISDATTRRVCSESSSRRRAAKSNIKQPGMASRHSNKACTFRWRSLPLSRRIHESR